MTGEQERVAVLTLTVMGLAGQLYASALPAQSEVSAWSPSRTGEVRAQCAHAGGAALAVGLAGTIVSKSWWPLAGVFALIVWWSMRYDSCARQTPPG